MPAGPRSFLFYLIIIVIYSDYYFTPRSAWSRVPPKHSKRQCNSSWKLGSAMLIIIAMLVLIAVFAIAGLALWMGALRTETKSAVIGYACNFRVARGERYNPMLKLNTSMVFREKERKYKNLIEVLFRRSLLGPAYRQAIIDKFENGTLKVFFRLYLDRRKVPRSVTNIEEAIEDVIVKETYSRTSLFEDREIDLTSISVKRINPETGTNHKAAMSQQRNTMITKNGVLRPHRNSSLIISPKNKLKPTKTESIEPEVDFSNIPTIQGTYKATKLNVNTKNGSKDDSKNSQDTGSQTLDVEKIFSTEGTTIKTTSTTAKSTTTRMDDKKKENIKVQTTVSTTIKNNPTTTTPVPMSTEFFNPYFENSPWKPIVPTYVNTELKLLLGKLNSTFAVQDEVPPPIKTEITRPESDKLQDDVTTKSKIKAQDIIIPSSIVDIEVPNMNIHGISSFDTEKTNFPHDRIVPQETTHFRINSKFKNIIAESSEENVNNSTVKDDEINLNPSIEVSGQVPKDTYDLHLKVSQGSDQAINDKPITEPETVSNDEQPTTKASNDELLSYSKDPNQNNFEFEPLLPDTHTPIILNVDDDSERISGVGVAEPVPEMEIDLEVRNRYSDIKAEGYEEEDETALPNRKVFTVNRQPIYTSYKTQHLNGNPVSKPSLIENPGTIKPFRHTIPVDKITSALKVDSDDEDVENKPMHFNESKIRNEELNKDIQVQNVTTENVTKDNTTKDSSVVRGMPEIFSAYNKNGNKSNVLENMERVVEVTTFVKDNENVFRVNFPLKNVNVDLEQGKHKDSGLSEKIDDDKVMLLSTTESASELVHPLFNNNQKLVNEDSHVDVPAKSYYTPSRNATFIEIDTVKHIPGQVTHHTHPPAIGEAEVWSVEDLNQPERRVEKKSHNGTGKSNPIVNLVTLAPAKSNSGVGRPIRPRPKFDREASSVLDTNENSTVNEDRTLLLEKLFSLQNFDDSDNDTSVTGSVEKFKMKNDSVEQIIEVVTSISTRISTSVKGNQIVVNIGTSNNSEAENIKVEEEEEEEEVEDTEPGVLIFGKDKPDGEVKLGSTSVKKEFSESEAKGFESINEGLNFTNSEEERETQSSDRKIPSFEEKHIHADQSKEYSNSKANEEPILNKPKNLQNNSIANSTRPHSNFQKPSSLEDLIKMVENAEKNRLLKNDTANYTVNKDGIRVLTRILNKNGVKRNITIELNSTNSNNSSKDNCVGFRCSDGKCLPSSARCNMLGECSGSEDEANCTCADYKKAQMLHHEICDGTPDCWDYSDESDCDWCKEGQFVCGNNKICIDRNKVCDGNIDCPSAEDEKKCAALIDEDESDDNADENKTVFDNDSSSTFSNTQNSEISQHNFTDAEVEEAEKKYHPDQDAHETSVLETNTFRAIISDSIVAEKLINEKDSESTSNEDVNSNLTRIDSPVIAGREIAMNSKDGFVSNNAFQANAKTSALITKKQEINNYHNKGYLSVRKNGKWGKLCLSDMSNMLQERQPSWSIEDLGRAVCKAITYQDYEKVEKVKEHRQLSPDRFYYKLSLTDKASEKTSLTFQPTDCPSREVLRVKCKNLECGIRTQGHSQARVVGGSSASGGSWPWQAAMYREGHYQCGGALISDTWILSAAHCFYRSEEEYWVARIGATRKGNFPSPHEQILRVNDIFIHHDYIDSGFINDIALLKLEKPVTFSDYIRPVCLPKTEVENGKKCIVTGWGQLFEIGRIFPDTLQEVELPIIQSLECRRKTLFLPLYTITSGMLCGSTDNGRDACLGDSGGPLVCAESQNSYTLQGITSNGYGCARPGRPGVYTKVYHYLSWIERTMSKTDSIMQSSPAICKGHRCPLGECLPKSRVCNGFLECSDGSDERNCTTNLR